MKKIAVFCLAILVLLSCNPFKKINAKLDALDHKVDQYHGEEMSTLNKNHQEVSAPPP